MTEHFTTVLDDGKNSPSGYTRKGLLIGDWMISIQATEYAYCAPRVTGMANDEYYLWEVALRCKTKDGKYNWIDKTNWPASFNKFADYWEDMASGVGAYIPTNVVQEIYETMIQEADND